MGIMSSQVRSGLTPVAALCQQALAGDDSAAIELITRLAAGDVQLMRYVSHPRDEEARRVREAVVRYVARGRWLGRPLPLSAGAHAGPMGRQLRDRIAQSCQTGASSCWEQTLLGLTRDPDPLVREIAIHLLECSRAPEVIAAQLTALGDRDERVRWAAAMELAKTGRFGPETVLHQLVNHEVTPESRHVMAYVLRRTADETLRQQCAPVVEALDAADYRVAGPLAANQVLATLGRSMRAGSP
jgi:hypothetical protein